MSISISIYIGNAAIYLRLVLKILGATNKDLYSKILQGQYRMPDDFSPEVRVLIKKMLRMNPHERPNAKEVDLRNVLY